MLKKPNKALHVSKKNAIHGVTFRGFGGKNRVPDKKSHYKIGIQKSKTNILQNFFDEGGKYLK
jgi:hypothetical protein